MSWFKHEIQAYTIVFFFMTSCGFAGGQERGGADPIRILERSVVDSVPADFPVGFAALAVDQRHYLAYYNQERYLTVAARDTSANHWQYKVLPTRVGWDSHNSIVMTMDKQACLHVSGNMHNDTLLYYKSEFPHDIGSLKRVFPLVAVSDESSCTYPSFIRDADGTLYFSYRIGGSGNGVTIVNRYNDTSKSFERLARDPLFDGLGEMSAYKRGPGLGPDGFFHLTWVWRDTPACETNHDLSYARSRDLVHWQAKGGGEPFRVPITPGDHRYTVDPVPPGGGVINGNFQLFFDQDHLPLIAYLKYDEKGFSQVYLARLLAGNWTSRKLSNWDYRWEFSGPGSINFEIRIGKTSLDVNGNIRIAYDHIRYGPGELLANIRTLELIADRKVDPEEHRYYPLSLLGAKRAEEGMQVRWKRLGSQLADQDTYYVLRWETQGKRRFYDAPDILVKPSLLELYKLERSKQP